MRITLSFPIRFLLERWIQRGVLHQLALMAALIASTAMVGGLAASLFTPRFDSPAAATWWSFLRLTDPGYLGDDEGTALRVISTIVTVLGYVLFIGSMMAVMTQWPFGTMRRLESDPTPISMRDHVIVLEPEDLVVLLAMTFDDCALVPADLPALQSAAASKSTRTPPRREAEKTHRVLVLSWSQTKEDRILVLTRE